MTKEYTIRDLSDLSGISYHTLANRVANSGVKPERRGIDRKTDFYIFSDEQVKNLTLSMIDYRRYMKKQTKAKESNKYEGLEDLTKETPDELLERQKQWLIGLGLAPLPKITNSKISYHNKGCMNK